eukprot:m.8904 g.8904  ORF g.8904 m.8904 type:complete len:252 (+) comp3297_c0_seq1:122-877(+)
MSARVFTPSNQKLLTNVAIVRMKKGGKRFEIACFKNKVVSWRKKIETDIDEVVQVHTIFTNVSKGQVANSSDLNKAFKTEDEEKILLLILEKGELQVSKQERKADLTEKFKEIATTVSEKCVNPDTQRPYTITQIEGAMRDLHFSVRPQTSTKSQALEVIRQLQETIKIERALMTVRLTLPGKNGKAAKDALKPLFREIESEEWDGDLELIGKIEPGNYKILEESASSQTKGAATLEILQIDSVSEGDMAL